MSRDNMMKFIPVEASKWGEMVQATARVKELEEALAKVKAEADQLKADLEKSDGVVWTLSVENARLKGEVEGLTERNQHLEQIDSYLQSANLNAEEQRSIELEAENARLKAEVERLTKAGDAMADELIQEYGREVCLKFGWFNGWIAAKKGVQS